MKKIKILVTVIMVATLVMGCAVENTSQSVSTNPQVPASVTQTAILPSTSTPQPTFTQTPPPTWIAEFAEPILKSISVRPPDYEDDFSDSGSGWPVGPIPLQDRNDDKFGLGESGYLDGEYYIETLPSHSNLVECAAVPVMNNLVMEIDVRFLSVDSGGFQIHFRHWNSNWAELDTDEWHGYMVNLMSFREIVVSHYNQDLVTDLGVEPTYQSCREFCRLLIIAEGPEIAVYLNGNPVFYAFDEEFEQYKGPGYLNLISANFTDKMTQVIHIDNFRLWDISALP